MPENENMPDSTTPDATTDATTDTAEQTPDKAQTTQLNEKGRKDGEPEQPEQKVDTTDKSAKSAKTDKPKASRPTHPEPVHSTSDRSETLRRVDGREMRLAVGNSPFPVEQTEAWERFEEAMGRPLWGRYLYEDEGKPVAAIALYRYEMGGQAFLWAKHGPVWLKEQSPEREAHLRRLLRAVVKERDRSVRFIRMHARYRDSDLRELLSTITYDRTYVIDLVPKTPEKMAAVMPKDGRRAVKRAERVAREAGCTISDETGLSREEFDKVYEVLRETAERDGFKPHDAEVYWTMLTALGEKNARLFVLRKDGVPHAWDLILTSGKDSVAYYGASSNESRTFRGAEALDWWAACTLAQEGYRGLDLMGAGSTRVPSLYTVGQYKKRYAQHVTEVDGAWDVPVSRVIYSGMATAKRLRDALRARRGSREH
ncbi:lipid II:glycine glycyltransferase FemX [Actinomyces naeslundii]|uniref:lipid II:glycine glycyltransferase FemX n=1 Tax=Actinomyces naeslundii TaxID=1655 RepID=UPI00096D88FE|nr:peptidoglycan bridge formation glycyltransferase FemA/FemB family protein [Actinomyces naeslundii]OMG22902.1 FemAB family protein [Actinomyces naeslundii]